MVENQKLLGMELISKFLKDKSFFLSFFYIKILNLNFEKFRFKILTIGLLYEYRF
mgnify:FL=1